MILALALEGTISKMEILSAYLLPKAKQIYWGHGICGIQSASKLYFGKHISLLSLGECAMLTAMIPAPELRSPFRDSSRGKIFQARVLKRMVEFGFLDVEMASIAVKQPLRFNSESPDHPDGSLVISSFSNEVKDPLKLWIGLKGRYDHLKATILPRARYEWMHLRFQDYKIVIEYNSVVFRITSQLKYVGKL
uniref:Penicillin-binding protein n=1 Tax=Solanum tuberosum TaxID=4113 RepID=M0ZK18_SOLTU